ncbi:hypothetical protein [Serratia entomophila]|uniref:Uncharacterized protein n=1 Tax=Serratia entomophila TaxID=42906 RepID=A0ABY5CUN6_9GAMM|nr:hypothetical protein [Serratia entomophila]USV01874.1 hypothetical protein KFQ06_04950 [Serratia entomophila]CAI0702877.1 Uncharacterised protein [Serratia entomophila]CAI0784023.1 Uncharacterised protein [Serratia entomophila]CAI0821885.1 Uncharacterised protein [Serratia entomophila]CAI1014955.1 Uncharacterised protein [Serratia entomophila]
MENNCVMPPILMLIADDFILRVNSYMKDKKIGKRAVEKKKSVVFA